MTSASLWETCWSRSAAPFRFSVPPASSAFFASAIADSRLETSAASSFALFSLNDFSVA